MSSDREVGGRLERAIDRAVRTMMSVDPPAGLRRRVLNRVNGRGGASREILTWRRALAGAAAVAVIILGVTTVRRDTPVRPAHDTRTTAGTQPPVEHERTTPGTPPAMTTPPRVPEGARASRGQSRPSRETIAMPPVANVFGAPTERVVAATVDTRANAPVAESVLSPDLAIAPLAPPPPIVVAPLSTAPIILPRIEVPPIAVPRILRPPANPPR